MNGFGSTGKQKNVNNCRRICDVCHKFMGNSVGYILPLEEKNFVDLTHNVSCDDFVSFVSYYEKNFGEKKFDNLFVILLRGHRKVIFIGIIGRFIGHLLKKQ